MKQTFERIEAMLAKVDFETVWPGFAPCDYVLFQDGKAYMSGEEIPWDARFMGCTSMEYEGRQIATWRMDMLDMGKPEAKRSKEPDWERHVAGIVHEMFHAFQENSGETRHIDEFALFMYPRDLDNFQLKMVENTLLVRAFESKNLADLQQFVAMRKARERVVGADMLRQEMLGETHEGMAKYAELMALRQLSEQKFAEDVQECIADALAPATILKPRWVSYDVGCLIALAMQAVGIDFYHALNETKTLFELIPHSKNDVETQFDARREELAAKFDEIRTSGKLVEIDTQIAGFNPMGMERVGDEIWCNGFVCLSAPTGETEQLVLQGQILLVMHAGEANAVKAYYIIER